MTRVFARIALAAGVMLFATRARSDSSTVLHEFVPDVDPDEALRTLSKDGAAPEAIEYGGEVLPAPEASATSAAPPMVAEPGDGALGEQPGQRSPSFRPDRVTELENELNYHEAFNPAIAPFKRVTALDATLLGEDGVTPVLGITDPSHRSVPIERADARPPDARARDRFWGEVTLDFSAGRAVPLPSVSPESRILSLRSEPSVDLAIERDGADNFFAVVKGGRPTSEVFVAFLTDAPRTYFGTVLPHVPLTALASHVSPIDPGIRKRARAFASELGIDARTNLPTALSVLTEHFRAFEESSEPPPNTGDIYLDLARAKKGVCRHRVYAFVVTAHALGIPARFVQNEAHSWVEVELPHLGWMRIDLGGAAHGLTTHGAEDRPVYRPTEPDPLPRPVEYEESYSQLGRNTRGLRKPGIEQLQGKWIGPAGDGQGAQAGDQAPFMSTTDGPRARDTSGRTALRVTLTERRFEALRGERLMLEGRIENAAAQGIEKLRVEVSLAADGRRERMLLGVALTDKAGGFRGEFSLPSDLAPGDYRLVVVTPGNEQYLPALAE